MRMIRTTALLVLAAALLPGVALADNDRDRDGDRDKRKGEGNPPVALVGPQTPAETVYIVKGTIKTLALPASIVVTVTKANDAGAKALGTATSVAGPLAVPVDQTVLLGPDTKVHRSSKGWKSDDSKDRDRKRGDRSSSDPASLQLGDEVKVKWVGAANLNGAGLAALAARQVKAKGVPGPPMVKFKVKGYVVSAPGAGALPITFLIAPTKVNENAARALNPLNPTITGGSYDPSKGNIPVILDANTKIKVKSKGHWGHHRSGKGASKLSRVQVGDKVEIEWKAPALARFWETPAREAEFKGKKRHK
jgi:hypothetical protein